MSDTLEIAGKEPALNLERQHHNDVYQTWMASRGRDPSEIQEAFLKLARNSTNARVKCAMILETKKSEVFIKPMGFVAFGHDGDLARSVCLHEVRNNPPPRTLSRQSLRRLKRKLLESVQMFYAADWPLQFCIVTDTQFEIRNGQRLMEEIQADIEFCPETGEYKAKHFESLKTMLSGLCTKYNEIAPRDAIGSEQDVPREEESLDVGRQLESELINIGGGWQELIDSRVPLTGMDMPTPVRNEGTVATKILDVLRMEQRRVHCALVLTKRQENEQISPLVVASFGTNGKLATTLGLAVVREKPPFKPVNRGLGQYRRKRMGDDQIFYAADSNGTCFCIVTGHQFEKRKATHLLREMKAGFSPKSGRWGLKASEEELIELCRKYNSKGFHLSEKHQTTRKRRMQYRTIRNVPTIPEATDEEADVVKAKQPERSFANQLTTTETPQPPLPRSRSKQLQDFAKLAQSQTQNLVRNRHLASRGLYRNGSLAPSITSLGSRDDMLPFGWETGSGNDALFIWEGLQPMDPTPTLFPYYESAGTSLPGPGCSTVRSMGTSTARTRSCEFIQWARHR
ncbi:expressed unknown protein [Seminavis robusta]|uniref:Uncharacterized protein n=1 Tax=Seminavis robusta TaxID=568900 RepID=A0A9N8F1E2_9STRA|nr:expressed unknown protein [Seminavis robusta]|eukprot:Sro2616_g332720.1 n/a (570) ;mRNA; f:3722-5607